MTENNKDKIYSLLDTQDINNIKLAKNLLVSIGCKGKQLKQFLRDYVWFTMASKCRIIQHDYKNTGFTTSCINVCDTPTINHNYFNLSFRYGYYSIEYGTGVTLGQFSHLDVNHPLNRYSYFRYTIRCKEHRQISEKRIEGLLLNFYYELSNYLFKL